MPREAPSWQPLFFAAWLNPGVLTIEHKRWRIDTEKLSTFQAAEDAGQILSERLSQLPAAAKRLMIAAAGHWQRLQ